MAYTAEQLRQTLAGVSWTPGQIQRCTNDRRRLIACIATADCGAIFSAAECLTEKGDYLTSCEPLLTALTQ